MATVRISEAACDKVSVATICVK